MSQTHSAACRACGLHSGRSRTRLSSEKCVPSPAPDLPRRLCVFERRPGAFRESHFQPPQPREPVKSNLRQRRNRWRIHQEFPLPLQTESSMNQKRQSPPLESMLSCTLLRNVNFGRIPFEKRSDLWTRLYSTRPANCHGCSHKYDCTDDSALRPILASKKPLWRPCNRCP